MKSFSEHDAARNSELAKLDMSFAEVRTFTHLGIRVREIMAPYGIDHPSKFNAHYWALIWVREPWAKPMFGHKPQVFTHSDFQYPDDPRLTPDDAKKMIQEKARKTVAAAFNEYWLYTE